MGFERWAWPAVVMGRNLSLARRLKNADLRRCLSLGMQSVMEDQVANKSTRTQQGARCVCAGAIAFEARCRSSHLRLGLRSVEQADVCVCTYTVGSPLVPG